MKNIIFKPLGIIHTPHTNPDKTPIQPVYAEEFEGKIEIFPEYADGLKDLDGFSHIYLLYEFHKTDKTKLHVIPFLDKVERGIFSTRAPFRPNKIGISTVELIKVEGNFVYVRGIDVLDGTPLIDIKPYTEKFDLRKVTKSGWQDAVAHDEALKIGKRLI